jgi:hypothetical protein
MSIRLGRPKKVYLRIKPERVRRKFPCKVISGKENLIEYDRVIRQRGFAEFKRYQDFFKKSVPANDYDVEKKVA